MNASQSERSLCRTASLVEARNRVSPASTQLWRALLGAAVLLLVFNGQAASRLTFDNQSGETALVKLVGPTASSVLVENGTKASRSVAAGHYFIKVRYGAPGGYSYSKGDEFDVRESATSFSDIGITLHTVVNGNYASRPIPQNEFENDGASDNSSLSRTADFRKADNGDKRDKSGGPAMAQQAPVRVADETWRTNWAHFVERLETDLWDTNLMEQEVVWEGEFARGLDTNGFVHVKMDPPLNAVIHGSRCEPVDQLALKPGADDRAAWERLIVGQRVAFAVKLRKNPFQTGVVWGLAGPDKKVRLLLAKEGGRVLRSGPSSAGNLAAAHTAGTTVARSADGVPAGGRILSGKHPGGDVVHWADGSIWTDVKIESFALDEENGGKTPTLRIQDVPPRFQPGEFAHFLSAALRTSDLSVPAVENSSSATQMR